jgi:hypothetical protein
VPASFPREVHPTIIACGNLPPTETPTKARSRIKQVRAAVKGTPLGPINSVTGELEVLVNLQ